MASTRTAAPASKAYPIPPGDPLADAHAAVSAWVEEVLESKSPQISDYRHAVPFLTVPSGVYLQESTPTTGRRFVLAAVAQVAYWVELGATLKAEAEAKARAEAEARGRWWVRGGHLVMWVWTREWRTLEVAQTLLRRALPWKRDDLLILVRWCGGEAAGNATYPVGLITRALERFAAGTPLDEELIAAIRPLVERFEGRSLQKDRTLARRLERLLTPPASALGPAPASAPSAAPRQPRPQPAPAGTAAVLVRLKHWLKMLPGEVTPEPVTTPVSRAAYLAAPDSPLQREHEWLNALFAAHHQPLSANRYQLVLSESAAGRALLQHDPATLGRLVLAAAERHVQALLDPVPGFGFNPFWPVRDLAKMIVEPLIATRYTLDRAGQFDILCFLTALDSAALKPFLPAFDRFITDSPVDGAQSWLDGVEADATSTPLTEGERFVLARWRAVLVEKPLQPVPPPLVARLTSVIGDGARFFLMPDEVWSDQVNDDLIALEPSEQLAWTTLLSYATTATTTRPTAKWLAAGGKLVAALGGDVVQAALLRWLPLVAAGRSVHPLPDYFSRVDPVGRMRTQNEVILRGLLWLVPTLPRPLEFTRVLTAVALSAYKKIRDIGARAPRVGNSALAALANLRSEDAVAQLTLLKTRIKTPSVQKEIEKALAAAAQGFGVPAGEVEEVGVPRYGFEAVGPRIATLGTHRAELTVAGTSATLRWFDAQGKALKSIPAAIKADHGAALKSLQQAQKDVAALLPVQRDRLDRLFLLRKSWLIRDWLDRYANHPLVGPLVRCLIWRIDGVAAVFLDGMPTDLAGHPIHPGPTAQVTTWHPVECPPAEVLAWRDRLETLGMTQPFKQAHREIYVLTAAERTTDTYSNRFAAHILRQHQFNALCMGRGWKHTLYQGFEEADRPPSRTLPAWNLRVEYWMEGTDEFNALRGHTHLITDQVRFTPIGTNEPLPLDQIPPLVFSEIMRDVDLFVGVTSIGNDPTWQDGGPDGRYQTYWQSYSFGELSGTATTRKQILARLVPRLKIADRCELAGRFLKVRGQQRTYKIHLGSGNILMEPTDEYLCIVPDARARDPQGDLFLPFEGDAMLSIILSKAFLLAADDKIRDPTITRQIVRR